MKKNKPKDQHYVDNKQFFQHMLEWKHQVNEAEDSGDDKPPVTEYMGKVFMQIAENLAKKPNFMNYQFKDDMICDGIENCIMYASNFDPQKSSNPFSYFTQIIYYAFLRRIQKEKKQNYVKYKYLQSLDKQGDFSEILKALGISEDETVNFKKMEEESKKKQNKIKKIIGDDE